LTLKTISVHCSLIKVPRPIFRAGEVIYCNYLISVPASEACAPTCEIMLEGSEACAPTPLGVYVRLKGCESSTGIEYFYINISYRSCRRSKCCCYVASCTKYANCFCNDFSFCSRANNLYCKFSTSGTSNFCYVSRCRYSSCCCHNDVTSCISVACRASCPLICRAG